MRSSVLIFVLLCVSAFSFAQTGSLVLKNVTSAEMADLKPTTGLMVYNTTEDAIYYYGNDGWYAFSGECKPKPVSPVVVSAVYSDQQLHVTFSPADPLLDYIIEDDRSNQIGVVNESPAVLNVSSTPVSISVRAKSRCGSSGPLGLTPVVTNEAE